MQLFGASWFSVMSWCCLMNHLNPSSSTIHRWFPRVLDWSCVDQKSQQPLKHVKHGLSNYSADGLVTYWVLRTRSLLDKVL